MLGLIALALIVMWLLGMFAFHVSSGLIHLLLVSGIIMLVCVRGSQHTPCARYPSCCSVRSPLLVQRAISLSSFLAADLQAGPWVHAKPVAQALLPVLLGLPWVCFLLMGQRFSAEIGGCDSLNIQKRIRAGPTSRG
jgi:hypothetical protein